MQPVSQWLEPVKDQIFYSLVSNRLIYNTCWEDPRIDRELLQIDENSSVLMLTSAGCNALAYLLDHPARIDTVDANPAQTAVMDLKKALFQTGKHELLWNYFGEGSCSGANKIYQSTLRPRLPAPSRSWWDQHIHFFEPASTPPSFYYRGTSGFMGWLIRRRIKRLGLYEEVMALLESDSLDEQKTRFDQLEDRIWNSFFQWLLNRDATMTLLGVPKVQRLMIEQDQACGMTGFIRNTLRSVFAQRPLRDNYFWRIYLAGRYTPSCCPEYLKKDHFGPLNQTMDRLFSHTCTLTDFLKQSRRTYSHFVLLDHQDWMAEKRYDDLAEEWQLLLNHSRPGTRILFRSAGTSADFIPEFARNRLTLHPELTEPLHHRDRVGTYGSTHLATVNSA